MLLLAPLFAFIRADFKVSYTELALALTVFNVVSAVLQTPIGFVVDRIGARFVLIAGLALSSVAFAVAGIVDSYWVFIAMYGVAGVGNCVSIRPIIRCCRITRRRSGSARCSRIIPLPASSARPLRR
jgi:sugar phosphate permease